ncbi:hypothetical protein SEA_KENNA_47 [Gordonia phage Kenna]|uniref:Uncharacterized protein n=2 Tax=Getalongvirus kenna TaxID=2734201 RepID=A0A3S9UPW5_9CAUD|nr:hypothetical protein HOU97_gp47 [Gordonia phage Kenna]AZS12324.1 hypothetical protein SEA_KENNA_47 [Gordonia phage Kenna]QCG77205.1 hypothetical protein SEA_LUTUM_48 [Gordonia phage Lutum]
MPEFKVGDRVHVKGMPPEFGNGTVAVVFGGRPEVVDVDFGEDGVYAHVVSTLEPSTEWADEYVHEYGAAGLVGCGRGTGGAISRMAGYTGRPRRTTTSIARVTCPGCLREADRLL